MARIVGAIACSHTPTIGFAHDKNKQDDPVWAPIFEAFTPIRAWLAAKQPDVLLVIYNDHVTSFFFDHYSAFALGIGESWSVADEGGGARALPPVGGHPALAQHIGASLMADEFDLSFFQDRPLDHGVFSPLSMLAPHEPAWPVAVVPLQVGVLQFPDSDGPALLEAGPGAAARDRELPAGPGGGDRRHRRAVPPGARRARRLQQHALGPAVPRPARARPRAARLDDARAVRDARRPRGRRGDHVAGDARRHGGARALPAPQLLPAVDGRHRHGDLRERRGTGAVRRGREPSASTSRTSSPASRRSREPTRSRWRPASGRTGSTGSCTG